MYVYIKGKMNITAQIQMTFTSAQGALFVHIQGYIPNILRQIDAAELLNVGSPFNKMPFGAVFPESHKYRLL